MVGKCSTITRLCALAQALEVLRWQGVVGELGFGSYRFPFELTVLNSVLVVYLYTVAFYVDFDWRALMFASHGCKSLVPRRSSRYPDEPARWHVR